MRVLQAEDVGADPSGPGAYSSASAAPPGSPLRRTSTWSVEEAIGDVETRRNASGGGNDSWLVGGFGLAFAPARFGVDSDAVLLPRGMRESTRCRREWDGVLGGFYCVDVGWDFQVGGI